jgi:hypothetical protein
MPVGPPPGPVLAFELLALVFEFDGGAGAVVVVVVVVAWFLSGGAFFGLELLELHPVQRAATASRASGARILRMMVSPIGNGVAVCYSSASLRTKALAASVQFAGAARAEGRGRNNKASLLR